MLPRLDPAVPLVWRDPHTLQLGVDRVVCVFPNVARTTEHLLAALQQGAPESSLAVIASPDPAGVLRSVGTAEDSAAEAAALLASVSDALLAEERAPEGAIVVDGAGPTAARIHRLLREAGHLVLTGAEANHDPGIARDTHTAPAARSSPVDPSADATAEPHRIAAVVLVGSFVIPPWRHFPWLRRDIPHLPIVFGDDGAEIGPFVDDSEGPCLRCLSLTRTDADPAWPAIAMQLDMRSPAPEPPLLSARVASLAAVWADAKVRTGDSSHRAASIRIHRDGGVSERSHSPHGLCGCRALPENVTALVGRPRSRPSSARVDAAPG